MKKKILLIAILLIAMSTVAQEYGTFIDSRDGKTYKTVKIDNRIWLAENLNFATDSNSYCYENNPSNCDVYGRLYNWENAKKACPSGWHLPSKMEWADLIEYLGGENVAFNKIVDNTNKRWEMPNNNNVYRYVDNSSGFSALPAGVRLNDTFLFLGRLTEWWTSTELDTNNAYFVYIENDHIRVKGGSKQTSQNKAQEYYSVRCIKD